MIRLTTSVGDIVLELDPQKAPKTVSNFEEYVRSGHYDGTIFHRVISGFMIQGGGFTADMEKKPTRAPVENEATNGLKNEPYTVAMARTGQPHSATAQFFINVAENHSLNHRSPDTSGFGYCVFGKVVEGRDVVDRIKAVNTGSSGGYQDVPTEPVIIKKAEIIP